MGCKQACRSGSRKKQGNLFKDTETVAQEFAVVNKLPYKFSYKFEDVNSIQSKLMIEDWEIGALYWKCLQNSRAGRRASYKKSTREILG